MTTIHIVDYGIGNIYNVSRAFQHVGANIKLCNKPNELKGATTMVLPGVGAFRDCIETIQKQGFEDYLLEHIYADRLFLGICVGMQMLSDGSEEFGYTPGWGVIPGLVKRISHYTPEGNALKVPHIGWQGLKPSLHIQNWENTPLSKIRQGDSVYFVHSYAINCKDHHHELAYCDYGGNSISAMVRKGNIYGTQFHPEKSGEEGLKILQQFVALANTQLN